MIIFVKNNKKYFLKKDMATLSVTLNYKDCKLIIISCQDQEAMILTINF
jgi:hypothetical protein